MASDVASSKERVPISVFTALVTALAFWIVNKLTVIPSLIAVPRGAVPRPVRGAHGSSLVHMRRPYLPSAVTLVALLLAACGGSTDAPTASTPSTPPPPTLTLGVNASRLRARRDSALLAWTTTNAASCTATGSWTGTQATAGSSWIKPTTTGTLTYSLECTGTGGTVSKAVSVEAWLPIPVAGTSYENGKANGRGELVFPPSTLNRPYTGLPTAYGFGDFFQTGRRDLVTASINYDASGVYAQQSANVSDVEVWREEANGGWTRLWAGKGCLHPRKVVVADFDNDQVPDIFIACHGWDGPITNGAVRGETSRLLLSNGRDGFTIREVGLPSYYLHGAAAADLDRDGWGDLVVADMRPCCRTGDGFEVFALMNQHDGTFRVDKSRIPATPDGQYISVELLDVDGDQNVDLLIGSGWSSPNDGYKPTLLLYGDAAGRFGLNGRQVTIPHVPNRSVVLDFALVENAGRRGLFVGRTGGSQSGVNYQTITLQYVDLATLASTVVLDQTGSGWVAWWIPTTRNGRNGVVNFAAITNGMKKPFSFFAAP